MKNVDLTRLKRCMKDAELGKELTIAFLGGSITQGSLATKEEYSYAHRVVSWWEKKFPQAVFHYVNAGIGGTTSHYGVARVVTDVLMYQPDLVIIDFSVNDEADEFYQETYEGMVRKVLSWPSEPAVILLNNVFYDTGISAQTFHNAVGNWYKVPHVSMKNTVYQRLQLGEFAREEITPDGLHPNDKGHELVAKEIIKFLEMVYISKSEQEYNSSLPVPMTANAYEDAKLLTIRNMIPKLHGFRADAQEKLGHLDHFKNGWIGKRTGDRIRFEVEASCIAVQYRKTVQKPACKARLILDGDEAHPVLLDGNFEEEWGDCLYLETVLHHGQDGKHTVEIEVLPGAETDRTPFYLMALIVA